MNQRSIVIRIREPAVDGIIGAPTRNNGINKQLFQAEMFGKSPK